MNCSCCASAGGANAAPRARRTTPTRVALRGIPADWNITTPPQKKRSLLFPDSSVRERPEAKLLLSGLPQAGESKRLDRQEEDDQGAERHDFEVGGETLRKAAREEGMRRDVQEDWQ